MDVYDKMVERGIVLPTPPPKGGVYEPAKRFTGNLVYVSGCGPAIHAPVVGKLGREFTVEQGQAFAHDCMLNVLAVLEAEIGNLRQVMNVAKLLVFVASDDTFTQQPQVANGASQLLVDLFGECVGLPARSAIGVNVLPGGIPVEVEALFEVAY